MDPTSAHKAFRKIAQKNSPLFDWPAKIILMYIIPLMLLISTLYLVTNQLSLMSYQIKQSQRSSYTAQQPTPQLHQPLDTSTWKTYKSQNFNFSLKYPNDWETYAYARKPKDEPLDFGGERFFKPIGATYPAITLNVCNNYCTSLPIMKHYYETKRKYLKNSILQEINIEGAKGYKLTGLRPSSYTKETKLIILEKNGTFYEFTITNDDYPEIFDQILSTLKFTD